MAFTVNFYTVSKKINSTALPGGAAKSYSCVTNDNLDILHPVIGINDGGLALNPHSYNYCYIPAFSRYYWVQTWTAQNGLWWASCTVDTLATYRSQIGLSLKMIVRANRFSDGSAIMSGVPDNAYPAKYNPSFERIVKPSIWSDTGCFVAGIVGTSGTFYYAFSVQNMADFLSAVLSDGYATSLLGSLQITLYPEAKIAANAVPYFTSIRYMPIPISSMPGTDVTSVYVGLVEVTLSGYTARRLSPLSVIRGSLSWSPMTQHRHPDAAQRGEWLNSAPWTEYQLFIPPWGIITLDPHTCAIAGTISADYIIDPATGLAVLDVSATVQGAPIHLARLQSAIGAEYPISKVAQSGYGGIQALQNAASIAANVAADNYLGAAAGAVGMIGNGIRGKIPAVSSVGSVGSLASAVGIPYLLLTFYRPVDDSPDVGRALMEPHIISELSGYVVCADGDVSAPATQSELTEIANYLTGGFYYE